MILALMLLSRHGKTRLVKWYYSFSPKEHKQMLHEVRSA